MPTRFAVNVNDAHHLLHHQTLQRLQADKGILVSKDGELVQRSRQQPSLIGRLFGRKSRYVYRTVHFDTARGRRLKSRDVYDSKTSRDAIAMSLNKHIDNVFGLVANDNNPSAQAIQRFITNSKEHIDQNILGQTSGRITYALDGKTMRNTLLDLGIKINYLSDQWKRKGADKRHDFDKTLFIYNATTEAKNKAQQTTDLNKNNASSPLLLQAAHNIRHLKGGDIDAITSPANLRAFRTALTQAMARFMQQENITLPTETRKSIHIAIKKMMLKSEKISQEQTQATMDMVLANMPTFIADVAYELKQPSEQFPDSRAMVAGLLKKHFTPPTTTQRT